MIGEEAGSDGSGCTKGRVGADIFFKKRFYYAVKLSSVYIRNHHDPRSRLRKKKLCQKGVVRSETQPRSMQPMHHAPHHPKIFRIMSLNVVLSASRVQPERSA